MEWSKARLLRFVEARLSPSEELGLHLTVGLALLVLAAYAFHAIAVSVMGQAGIVQLDLQVAQWFHVHAFEPLTTAVLALTHLHSVAGVACLSALLGLYFWRRGEAYWLLALALSVSGGMVINVLLKYGFQRSRPVFEEPLLTLATYSFPSGHTAGAATLYGVLACYLVRTLRGWPAQALAAAAALLMVLLVATSRLYLGAHYLSDVLAALAESCAWLSICVTASATLRRRAARLQG
ncbi:phosphatase PAP2 family protein [Oxalobacteraceae bacterium]|nr:phosphatase PAP2 family protein [Oxalobacteraceae bacterium]